MRQSFSEAKVRDFLREVYQLDVIELSTFSSGVIDTNFHVVAAKQYVFKIFTSGLSKPEIEQQVEFMSYCKKHGQPVQTIYPSKDGVQIVDFEKNSAVLLEYIDGEMLKEVELNEHLLQNLARVIAEFQKNTKDFTWPKINDHHIADFLQFLQFEKFVGSLKEKQELIDKTVDEYKNALPTIKQCRMATIHHDFNHENTIVKNGEIAGVVDFGNATHTILVADIIISIGAVCFSRDEPLKTARILFQAYEKQAPLTIPEKEVLYTLFKVRFALLCLWAQGEILNGNDVEGIRWYKEYSYKNLKLLDKLGEDNFYKQLGIQL